jgi:hypothetical protein
MSCAVCEGELPLIDVCAPLCVIALRTFNARMCAVAGSGGLGTLDVACVPLAPEGIIAPQAPPPEWLVQLQEVEEERWAVLPGRKVGASTWSSHLLPSVTTLRYVMHPCLERWTWLKGSLTCNNCNIV